MTKNKFFKMLTLIFLAMSMLFTQVACGSATDDEIVDDGVTLNVKFYDAGYGRSYIYALEEAFETTFASQGYKLNILPPDAELGNTNLLMDIYKDSGADIYFCSCSTTLAASGYMGQYSTDSLVLDITDTVMNKKPIKLDGTEEATSVLDKLEQYPAIVNDLTYREKYYKIPYVTGMGGLAVNTRVLDEYDLGLPRTTNELFEISDEILAHVVSDGGPEPFTYSTAEYPDMMLKTWFRQYVDDATFNKFYSMEEADGTKMTTPYDVFGKDGSEFEEALEKAFEAYYQVFDPTLAAAGSTTQDFTSAQAKLMQGNAVFYIVGDFMLNEEYKRNERYLDDVTFINFPVLSAVGVKAFGSGTTYNMSDADCEKVLLDIIDGVDANKTVAEIKAIIDAKYSKSFAEADIKIATKARGTVFDQSGSSIFISKNVTPEMKPIAETFLRFCASDDVGAIIAKNTRTNNPFSPSALADNEIAWIKSTCNTLKNDYCTPARFNTSGYRSRLALGNFVVGTNANTAVTLIEQEFTIYDDDLTVLAGKSKADYLVKAVELVDKIYAEAKRQFENSQWREMEGEWLD